MHCRCDSKFGREVIGTAICQEVTSRIQNGSEVNQYCLATLERVGKCGIVWDNIVRL